MRLIDADVLEFNKFAYIENWGLYPQYSEEYKRGFNDAVDATLNIIQKAPTVDPVPKGKWIRNFDGNEWHWFCSNCKEQWYEEDLWMGGNDFPNFCPNCGADMRGDV